MKGNNYKTFATMHPAERAMYIDWVDAHYRYYFVGDIPKPPKTPTLFANAPYIGGYTWRGRDVADYLGRKKNGIGSLTHRKIDPLPHMRDRRGHVYFKPEEVKRWAKRNPTT